MLIDADSDHAADAVTPAVAPGVTHFGAYHRPSSGNFQIITILKGFMYLLLQCAPTSTVQMYADICMV